MKLKTLTAALAMALSTVLTPAWGHGTAEHPATPTELSDEFIVHRLKQLGYTQIRVVRSSKASADVELQKDNRKFAATVSRRLTGPDTIAVVNAAEVVERSLKPVDNVPRGTVTPR
jgi:hypothetical protein